MALFVDIEKKTDDFHLKLCFEADRGVLALLGASGCGKSMALKCIAGIERPDRGRIVLNGRTLYDSQAHIDLPPQKRRVGYLFQSYALFPGMSVERNIACGLRGRRDAAAVREMIDRMGLTGLEKAKPATLSGGEQQRTALARILISEPDVLLLDEPFCALDRPLRARLEREVRTILDGFDGPAVLVSHDREEVYRLSDRVAIMNSGHLETVGPKRAVFAAPRTVYGAELTGWSNISPVCPADDGSALALRWGVRLAVDGPVGDATHVAVDAHGCRISAAPEDPAFTVVSVEEGAHTDTLVLSAGAEPLRMEAPRGHLPGETLHVSIPPQAVALLKGASIEKSSS